MSQVKKRKPGRSENNTSTENKSVNLKPTERSGDADEAKSGCCARSCSMMVNIIKWPLILLIIPPLINYASLKQEQDVLIPTDAVTYDVGQGQKLMLRCKGKGAPTVILEAPSGTSSDIWTEVRRDLSKLTCVCVYDRAGLGFSDRPIIASQINSEDTVDSPPKKPEKKSHHTTQEFTVERMSEDLRRLVTESSSQPQPFILVGSELGALVARFYSHMYDSHINHVILIDPLSPELFSHEAFKNYWKTQVLDSVQSRQLTGALGLNRLGFVLGLSDIPVYWSHVSERDVGNITTRQKHLSCHPKHLKSSVDECAGVLDSLQQIRTLSSVKPMPGSIQCTIFYRKVFDIAANSEVNNIWWNTRENIASGLNIPSKQMHLMETNSTSTYDSLSGKCISNVRNIIQQKITEFRKGKAAKTS